MKICQIRPRKFRKLPISQNALVESKFWLKIRTSHKIYYRMIYYDNRLINTWRSFQWILVSTPTQSFIRRETLLGEDKTHHHNKLFDRKFYDEFEFSFKILIPPTHFEISPIFYICVGGFKKFLLHWTENSISNRMICILHMLNVFIGWNSKFLKNE